MNREQLELLAAMSKIAGLKDLAIPIEGLPSDAEFAKMLMNSDAEYNEPLEMDFSIPMMEPLSATGKPDAAVSAKPMPKSTPINIRIPTLILRAIKEEAKRKGTRYQTAINKLLKAGVFDNKPANRPTSISLDHL